MHVAANSTWVPSERCSSALRSPAEYVIEVWRGIGGPQSILMCSGTSLCGITSAGHLWSVRRCRLYYSDSDKNQRQMPREPRDDRADRNVNDSCVSAVAHTLGIEQYDRLPTFDGLGAGRLATQVNAVATHGKFCGLLSVSSGTREAAVRRTGRRRKGRGRPSGATVAALPGSLCGWTCAPASQCSPVFRLAPDRRISFMHREFAGGPSA